MLTNKTEVYLALLFSYCQSMVTKKQAAVIWNVGGEIRQLPASIEPLMVKAKIILKSTFLKQLQAAIAFIIYFLSNIHCMYRPYKNQTNFRSMRFINVTLLLNP